MTTPAYHIDGAGKTALEIARTRLVVGAVLFSLGFMALSAQLVKVSLFESAAERSRTAAALGMPLLRADIVDRNGTVLATNLETHSLYADARLIRTPAATAARLARIVPDLDRARTQFRLASDRGFVWIRRHLTPRQAYEINRLGEPGLQFLREQRRVYPQGEAAAHLVGFTDVDNVGLAGIEKAHEARLTSDPDTPLALSLDIRFQHILRQELAASMATYSASGAAGVIVDVDSGEVVAMVSLPDFDPNRDPGRASSDARFNRASLGIYEMGSTFKTFTVAAALDAA
ncbi:MAG: penicillin-binding transpeptidase domain-containing protein, partial [Alphaproteobacteria bacterium]|nr:penicillin-binding transpeptidase domain-containing protein [Alphaproteobacteria bacterium]